MDVKVVVNLRIARPTNDVYIYIYKKGYIMLRTNDLWMITELPDENPTDGDF